MSEVSMCDVGIYQELASLIRQAHNAAERAHDYAMEWGLKDFKDLALEMYSLNALRCRAEEKQREAERKKVLAGKQDK